MQKELTTRLISVFLIYNTHTLPHYICISVFIYYLFIFPSFSEYSSVDLFSICLSCGQLQSFFRAWQHFLMLFQTVSTFLRFTRIPDFFSDSSCLHCWQRADVARLRWQARTIFDWCAIYAGRPSRSLQGDTSPISSICSIFSLCFLSFVSTSEFEFELCLDEKFKQQAGGLNSDP